MTCTIHKHIVTIILTGALMLFMGFAAQTAYADEEYSVTCSGFNSESIAIPGVVYELSAQIQHGDVAADLPEGVECRWRVGFQQDGISADDVDKYADISPVGDTTKATLQFFDIPDGANSLAAYVAVKLVKQDEDGEWQDFTEEFSAQMNVQDDFYEVLWPDIDPEMLAQEPSIISVKVLHHEIDPSVEAGETVTVADAECTWDYDDSIVKVVPGERQKDGSYPFTITRLRADVGYDYLTLDIKSGENYETTQSFPLHKLSMNLKDGSVMILDNKDKKFTVYEDNWVFFDDSGWKNPGVDERDLYVSNGNIVQQFKPELFEMTAVEKYMGYTENDDNALKPWKFPLKYDGKNVKNKNGDRTDGTALYYFVVKAKPGSGWTGQIDMFLFVCNKYSLYNFRDFLIGYVEFPSLAKYLKDWDKEPYERYEVPKGSKAKKTMVVKLGKDTLTPGKQITVKYRNDKTKKEYSSFPTNKPGEYTVIITGKSKSPYYGTDKSTHLKIGMKNTLAVKGKTVKIKKKKIKKKTQKVKASKVVKIKKKGKGKLTYKKLSGNKKITVASNGKVTVKKGLKKGTYKVKVSVTAAGNAQYFPITKKVTFKIKVK